MKLKIAILITLLVTLFATTGSLFAMTETKLPDIYAFTRGVERSNNKPTRDLTLLGRLGKIEIDNPGMKLIITHKVGKK